MRWFVLLLAVFSAGGCASTNIAATPGDVAVRLVLPDSVVTQSGAFPVEVYLTNVANYPVRLPHRVYFTSNLHPNGLDLDHTGLLVDFRVEPQPDAFVLIEMPTVSFVTDYDRLGPGETRVIACDLSRHLRCEPGEPATGVSRCPGESLLSSGRYTLHANVVYNGGGFTIPLPCDAWRGSLSTGPVPFVLQ